MFLDEGLKIEVETGVVRLPKEGEAWWELKRESKV
jgi:hypothetical protein